jgi:Predicted ATPase
MNDNGKYTDGAVVPKRILASLLASVSAGVVPRSGAPYIAIGRNDEIAALLTDLEQINDGGGAMRFLIGRYGSGKSFLMQLVRGFALERNFITADADLSPERRLCGSSGSGVATYRELVRNLASKTSPDGGALPVIITRWLSRLQSDVASSGISVDDPLFEKTLSAKIHETIKSLEFQVGGFDFAIVLTQYYKAHRDGDDDKRSACMRWLRGEFPTKTEARNAIGISIGSVIDDDNWYDYIKLISVFARKIGYRGLVVFIDECVNLYKITNRISRENNYEKILSMFNDTLQGKAEGLMLVLGGTPQFLEDSRRGLFSYEALRSRLCDGKFDSGQYRNLMSPVIRLRRLSDDELLALIVRLTKLHSQYYTWDTARVTSEDMVSFLKICLNRAGADTMVTPREIIRDYMTVLNIICQNDSAVFASVVGANKNIGAPSAGSSAELEVTVSDDDDAKYVEKEQSDYTLDDIEF